MSRRPGLGLNYLDTHSQWHKEGFKNYTKVNGQIGRLPRYYKDKLFTVHKKAMLAKEAIALSDEQYNQEIERLAKLHPHPQWYYEESQRFAHDKVKDKSNAKHYF